MHRIDPRSLAGRLLAFGLLGLMLAAVHAMLIAPSLRASSQLRAEITATAHLLPRFQRLAAQQPALAAAIEDETARSDWSAAYIDAPSAALASARLQRQLTNLLELAGARLDQAAVAPVQAARPGQIGVMLHFYGTYPALLAILAEIETGRTALAVDHLRVRHIARAASIDGQGRELRIELGVSGLMKPEAGP